MTRLKASEDQPPAAAALDSKPLDAIGRALRAHYDDLLRAPLPQRFIELLSRLDAAEKKAKRDFRR